VLDIHAAEDFHLITVIVLSNMRVLVGAILNALFVNGNEKLGRKISLLNNMLCLRTIASLLHSSIDQKYDIFPYSHHLKDVESVLINHNIKDEDILLGAWFHDTIEDIKHVTEDYLLTLGVPPETVHICSLVSDEDAPTRKERKLLTYKKIITSDKATALKLADRIANLSHGVKNHNSQKLYMYLSEHKDFYGMLYTESKLCEPLWTTYLDIIRNLTKTNC
jgi:(p)ppGpp synthase/HD superfamily hydrolase